MVTVGVPRLVVTRPEPECSTWVRRLAAAGVPALCLPLLELRPVGDASAVQRCWRGLAGYRAVMFVSGAAVRHFHALRPPDVPPPGAPAAAAVRCWAPGPGTARVLAAEGVAPDRIDAPDSGRLDSEALWAIVADQVHAGDSVLIVRGQEAGARGDAAQQGAGRDWLTHALKQAGARVDRVAAYQRCAPRWDDAQTAAAREAVGDGSVWLVTSSQSLAYLRTLLPEADWGRARALATHPRIAQALHAAGFGVVDTSLPSLAEVLASIESGA